MALQQQQLDQDFFENQKRKAVVKKLCVYNSFFFNCFKQPKNSRKPLETAVSGKTLVAWIGRRLPEGEAYVKAGQDRAEGWSIGSKGLWCMKHPKHICWHYHDYDFIQGIWWYCLKNIYIYLIHMRFICIYIYAHMLFTVHVSFGVSSAFKVCVFQLGGSGARLAGLKAVNFLHLGSVISSHFSGVIQN